MGERKQRSDKKKDVKVTVDVYLKDAIYRLAYLTQTKVKDACEQMIKFAMTDTDIINSIALHFRRDIRINSALYVGSTSNTRVDMRIQGEKERMSTRLTARDFEVLSAFAYALDVRPARAAAVLIEMTMRDYRFVNNYVKCYLHSNLDDKQMRELRSILSFINANTDEHFTWATLLSTIANEVSTPIARVKDAVNEFVIRSWRD